YVPPPAHAVKASLFVNNGYRAKHLPMKRSKYGECLQPCQCSVKRLRRRNLPVNTLELARYLIGKTLVHDLPAGRLSGRIVETEGYPPGDAAGRSFRGKTPSNQSLFLRRGYCHIYFTYGSSFMVNVTSEEPGIGAGVLLRALEPIEGIDTMQRFRNTARIQDIARG